MKACSIPIRGIVKDNVILKITVKGLLGFRITTWIGAKLIKLSAKIMGIGLKLEMQNPNKRKREHLGL